MLTHIFCLTKNAAPKKGGAGRFSFLILPDFVGSVEKHFPPATRLPGFGPCDLGSILPSRLPLEITTCGYVQATLLHLRGLAGLARRERVETHDNSWGVQALRAAKLVSVITTSSLSRGLLWAETNGWKLVPMVGNSSQGEIIRFLWILLVTATSSTHPQVKRGKGKTVTLITYVPQLRFWVLYLAFHHILVSCG